MKEGRIFIITNKATGEKHIGKIPDMSQETRWISQVMIDLDEDIKKYTLWRFKYDVVYTFKNINQQTVSRNINKKYRELIASGEFREHNYITRRNNKMLKKV